MRSYAGMVENAMSDAEARAKQVGSALARDTSGQAQAALAQIERLREEAQAHTARAVGDLKGSFETVITQIGRQLEQMRGQFDNTSRGMRETAQQTASDLDSMRQEMQKRMQALPEQTAQATAAIRKALSEQLREIEAITPVLTRAATPACLSPARQASRRRRVNSMSARLRISTPEAASSPRRMVAISDTSRAVSPSSLPALPMRRAGKAQAGTAWSVGDLLSRARTRSGLCRRRPDLRQPRRTPMQAGGSSVSTRLRGPSTTAPPPTSGSASGPVSAACSVATSTPSTARRPSTRWLAATIARPISA